MKISIKYDMAITCKAIVQEQLDKLDIPHTIHGIGEIEIQRELTSDETEEMMGKLANYGIHVLNDQKLALVHRIKNTIKEMLESDNLQSQTISQYLADKLNYSYTYLSNLFSEATHTSIENFVILCKVDHAKELMANTNLTLTEIAYRLNYSSVAHLSSQFKKTTGLTPTTFQKILEKRRGNLIQKTI
ncbi:helix-turn-helix domain-containing protein [Allomuricauda sp. F6463D]|uniref:helix-turn-helix domain-containing protein n=1 Tax=Allomuricauda sp. F6463D TaxID=2926409 RepID=UPI001FF6C136|nr:AraC family transcriptional regulator [Muricauda sp. F6463D]MCK0159176.1 AraC family transcriptional regulator [Muricauda sp. F6463D]